MPVLANLCKTYLYYTLYVIYIQYVNKGHIMPTLIIQCVYYVKLFIYLFIISIFLKAMITHAQDNNMITHAQDNTHKKQKTVELNVHNVYMYALCTCVIILL